MKITKGITALEAVASHDPERVNLCHVKMTEKDERCEAVATNGYMMLSASWPLDVAEDDAPPEDFEAFIHRRDLKRMGAVMSNEDEFEVNSNGRVDSGDGITFSAGDDGIQFMLEMFDGTFPNHDSIFPDMEGRAEVTINPFLLMTLLSTMCKAVGVGKSHPYCQVRLSIDPKNAGGALVAYTPSTDALDGHRAKGVLMAVTDPRDKKADA